MSKGTVQAIYGSGCGKSTAAIGKGILAVNQHKTVIMIQFLKGSLEAGELDVLKRLEPEMKIFRFEKASAFFETLSDAEKKEELMNIRNGLNFAKKVLTTGECDLLILDEFLGILDYGMVSAEEFRTLIQSKEEDMDIILTGNVFPKELHTYADSISRIENVEVDNIKQ